MLKIIGSMIHTSDLKMTNLINYKGGKIYMFPLKNIMVVSLEQAVAAPFASRHLADLGARVIKVERPSGDFAREYDTNANGMSSHFVWLNRSKESIVLDLKTAEGKDSLNKLLQKADVFIQNLAPGAVTRLGFSEEYLLEQYPNLIICNISGYGSEGPYSDRKAYDLLIQCEAGLVSITGTENTPSKSGISIADIAAGMYAYTGVLSALINRGITGKGTILEVSMLEALGEWMGYPLHYSGNGGNEPLRTGAEHATIYPYGPFKANQQNDIFIAIQNNREWESFCINVLRRPDIFNNLNYCSNTLRSENRKDLKIEIENIFNDIEIIELMNRLESAKIAFAKLNSILDFIEHPQLKYRDCWVDVDSPVGKIKSLLPVVKSKDFKFEFSSIPSIGEHTESLKKEFDLL